MFDLIRIVCGDKDMFNFNKLLNCEILYFVIKIKGEVENRYGSIYDICSVVKNYFVLCCVFF